MKKSILLGVLALGTLSGCSTIVGGRYQTIYVDTTHGYEPVAGATCSLMSDKGTWVIKTPARVTVRRANDDLTINCTKESYPSGSVTASSSVNGIVLYNVFTVFIGAIVDYATQSAYEYPSQITIDMGSTKVFSSPGLYPEESAATK